MFAIIDDRGQQYKVAQGDRIDIQLQDLDENQQTVEFNRVLMIGGLEGGPKIGAPAVEGAKVVAKSLGEVKGDKIVIQKFRRRKNYKRKTGHRQRYLRLQIESITF